MTIHVTNRMELLSQSYVQAVAAYVGIQVTIPKIDNHSVDGTFISSSQRKPRLDFQLKATYSHDFANDLLSFPLDIKNYNDLREEDRCYPIILVLLVMPKDETDWIDHSEESLEIKNCAYWVSLANKPETSNTSTITVTFDKKNFLSPSKLKDLLELIGNGGTP